MQPRALDILEAVIKDFIKTGTPVSSASLFEKHDFGIKPARIRNELNELTQDGYLEQPHTSGGRVPTHKGYRFIANKTLKTMEALKKGLAVRRTIDRRLEDLIEEMADGLHLLGVGYRPEEKEIYKHGLDDLFGQLSIETKRDVLEVVQDFEAMDRHMDEMWRSLTGREPSVFIGRSPVTRSKHLSVIADVMEGEDGEFLLMAIGPTRMDYEKVLKRFEELS